MTSSARTHAETSLNFSCEIIDSVRATSPPLLWKSMKRHSAQAWNPSRDMLPGVTVSSICEAMVSNSDFNHHGDRSQRRTRHRFAGKKRSRIGISPLDLQHGFCFRYLLHHRQYRVPQIVYRIEQCALACAVDSALSEKIIPKSPRSQDAESGAETKESIQESLPYPSIACTER